MFRQTHSYHYFHDDCIPILEQDTIINKKTKEIILKLNNFCEKSVIFTPILEKMMKKKKSLINYKKWFGYREIECHNSFNTKVSIDINTNNIIDTIKRGEKIHHRKELFKMLRRNYVKLDLNTQLSSVIKPTPTPQFESHERIITYYDDNIIKYDNIYLDTKNERIYLDFKDINKHKNNIILNGGVFFYNKTDILTKCFHDIKSNNSVLIVYNTNLDIFKTYLESVGIDYKVIHKSLLDEYTYNDINNGVILVHYSVFLSQKYNNFSDCDCIVNNIQTLKYEYSFIDKTIFLQKNNVIFQLIDYDIIYFEDTLSTMTSLLESHIRCLNGQKKIIVSNLFYKYTIANMKDIINIYFNKNLDISRHFLSEFKSCVFLESLENLKINESTTFLNYTQYEKELLAKTSKDNVKLLSSLSLNITKIKLVEQTDIDVKKYNNDKTCSICLDSINKNDWGKTDCNHHYCYSCIYLSHKTSKHCPNCRNTIKSLEKIISLKNPIINSYKINIGVKMDALLKLLDNNVLIVSEFPESIKSISDMFQTLNINFKLFYKKNNKITIKHYTPVSLKIKYIELYLADHNTLELLNEDDLTKIKNVIFLEPFTEATHYLKYKVAYKKIRILRSD
jgi:hypothetical protein